MHKRVFALVVAALFLVVGLTSAQSPVLDRILERGEIRVATSGNQPPFNATSKDGQLMGLEIDLIRALAETMNVDLSLTSHKGGCGCLRAG